MINFPNAKINLGLRVTGKRPDGYHNIETVFYPLSFVRDILEAVPSEKEIFHLSGLPLESKDEDNLVLRAYHAMAADWDMPPLEIFLHKAIPFGAGLGGGSADAAFFIKLTNKYLKLGLSREQMLGYASRLGADCAFFIDNSPAFASGIGDVLTPVPLSLKGWFLVLAVPPVNVSTQEAYRGLHVTETAASPLSFMEESPLWQALKAPVDTWRDHVVNDFERSIFPLYPEIADLKARMYDLGAVYASMSGSGSSVYGLFDHEVDGQAAFGKICCKADFLKE